MYHIQGQHPTSRSVSWLFSPPLLDGANPLIAVSDSPWEQYIKIKNDTGYRVVNIAIIFALELCCGAGLICVRGERNIADGLVRLVKPLGSVLCVIISEGSYGSTEYGSGGCQAVGKG